MEPVSIIGYIALAIGSVLTLFSRIPKQTIANQKDLIDTYEKRLKTLEDQGKEDKKQHIENVKAIAELQGQIKVYKELPLQDMALAMKEMASASRTNADYSREILKTLKSSAKTLAFDTEQTMQGTAEVALELKKNK